MSERTTPFECILRTTVTPRSAPNHRPSVASIHKLAKALLVSKMHCYERISNFEATLRRLISILVVVVTSLGLSPPIGLAQLRTSGMRKIVVQVSPEYPAIAQKMHLADTVRLLATVNRASKVTKTKVLKGSPMLAQAAADAVIKSKWESGSGETKEIVEVKFQPDTD